MFVSRPRVLLSLALVVLVAGPATAATVLRLDLDQLLGRAGKVFRGTVLEMRTGSVEAGGTTLPTVTYVMRVDEAFKGVEPGEDNAKVEVTMVGTIKKTSTRVGQFERFSILPEVPNLMIGSDYLLITTSPSSVGLSTTVGLGQGAFAIFTADRQEFAVNAVNNDNLGLGTSGPIPYAELAAKIRSALGR